MTNQTLKPKVLVIGDLSLQDSAEDSQDRLTILHHGCKPLIFDTTQSSQPEGLLHQLEDIQQSTIQAIKIGLLFDVNTAKAAGEMISRLPNVPVILDFDTKTIGNNQADEVTAFAREHLLPNVDVLITTPDGLAQLIGAQKPLEQSAQAVLTLGVKHCLVINGHHDTTLDTHYFVNQDASFYCYQDLQRSIDSHSSSVVLASSIASHLASGQDVRDAVVLAKAYWHRGVRLSSSTGVNSSIVHSQESLALQDLPKLCYQADFVGKHFEFPDCADRLGIYPVVDSADWVQKLVDCGVPTIQLRIKDQASAILDQQIKKTVDYLSDKPVSFFVNDYWQLAIKHRAYGVHLGQEDLHDAQLAEIAKAGLRLGVSTHSYWELARALAVNPSYIALGPIYATTSKQMPFSPQGEARLQQWVHLLADHYPLVAIGGIDLPRAKQLKHTGVGSVAMISAITKADDYQKATKDFLKCWETGQ